MRSRAFRAKRALLKPVTTVRRRRHGGGHDGAPHLLEHHAYSKAIRMSMVHTALDPDALYGGPLDESSVVMDVGAYTGETVERYLSLHGCRVLAFEPHPTRLEELGDRFGDDERVTICPYGLGAQDARVPLVLAGAASSVRGGPDGRYYEVEVEIRDVATVIEELGLERIDLLKVNIEGAEFDLFERLIETGLLDRIRYIVVQFHEWYPGAYRRRRTIRKRLGLTHVEEWSYPWVWERWRHKGEPTPPVVEGTPELVEALREQAAQRRAEDARRADS